MQVRLMNLILMREKNFLPSEDTFHHLYALDIKSDYYQYARPNDKLPSVKCAFWQAKGEMQGLQMHLQPRFWLVAEMSNNFAWEWEPEDPQGYHFNAIADVNLYWLTL